VGELRSHLTECRRSRLADAYLHTKWHLNPSNRLATIHRLHRQDSTGQTGQITFRQDIANRFTNGRPTSLNVCTIKLNATTISNNYFTRKDMMARL